MAQLKPTASRKEKEDNCTTPAKQRPRLPFLLCSTDVEDGRDLDAGDSMLGQPPSICAASSLTTGSQRHRIVQSKCDSDSEDFEMDMERGLDVALRQVYHEVQEKNIEACVLDERLDEKDVALMDGACVPVVFAYVCVCARSFRWVFPQISRFLTSTLLDSATPSPAHCAPGRIFPACELESPHMWKQSKSCKPSAAHYTTSCKGHQAAQSRIILEVRVLFLNSRSSQVSSGCCLVITACIDTPRPFKFTPPIPTDESVTLVEGSALEDLEKLGYTNKTSETKIYGALQDLETVSCRSGNVAGSRNFDNIRGTGNIGLSPPRLNKPILEDQGLELVLTKRERRLLAGLSEFETRQEYRGEEQQDEASLVTEDHDQPIDGNEQLPNECPPVSSFNSCLERRMPCSWWTRIYLAIDIYVPVWAIRTRHFCSFTVTDKSSPVAILNLVLSSIVPAFWIVFPVLSTDPMFRMITCLVGPRVEVLCSMIPVLHYRFSIITEGATAIKLPVTPGT